MNDAIQSRNFLDSILIESGLEFETFWELTECEKILIFIFFTVIIEIDPRLLGSKDKRIKNQFIPFFFFSFFYCRCARLLSTITFAPRSIRQLSFLALASVFLPSCGFASLPSSLCDEPFWCPALTAGMTGSWCCCDALRLLFVANQIKYDMSAVWRITSMYK